MEDYVGHGATCARANPPDSYPISAPLTRPPSRRLAVLAAVTVLQDTAEILENDADGKPYKQYAVQAGKKLLTGATREALVTMVMTDTASGTATAIQIVFVHCRGLTA